MTTQVKTNTFLFASAILLMGFSLIGQAEAQQAAPQRVVVVTTIEEKRVVLGPQQTVVTLGPNQSVVTMGAPIVAGQDDSVLTFNDWWKDE